MKAEPRTFSDYRLRFGRDLSADNVVGVLTHLATTLTRDAVVVSEVAASADRYEFTLRVPPEHGRQVLAQLRSALPLRIEPVERTQVAFDGGVDLRLDGARGALRTRDADIVTRSLLTALRPGRGEQVVVQWVLASGGVGPGEPSWSELLDRQRRQLLGRPSFVEPKAAELKARQPQLRCSACIVVKTNVTVRTAQLLQVATAAVRQTSMVGTQLEAVRLSAAVATQRIAEPRRPSRTTAFRLTADELAPILGWPIGGPALAGLDLGVSRHFNPAESIPRHGIVIGHSTMPGGERAVALSPDGLCHHVALTAPTGTGKSTVLGNVTLQAVNAGMGVVLCDWKGDLVQSVLDRLPLDVGNRLVVLDPTATDAVVGLPNPLNAPSGDRDRRVDQLIGWLQGQWEASWGPRTGALVQVGLFTLARAGGSALVDLPELLTNPVFRREVLARVSDAAGIKSFWRNFEAMSEAERAQVIAPTLNRARPWVLRRNVRHLLGQVDSTWEMDAVLNGGILLVNLASGVLGDETAALAGSLVMGEIAAAIRRRARLRSARRKPALVVLDEFQHLGNSPSFGEELVSARGLGVGFAVAHQNLHQLSIGLRETLLANARSKIAFQLGASDAAVYSRELEVDAGDLQALPAYEAIARLTTRAGVSPPVSLRTMPLPSRVGAAADLRRSSQSRYGMPRGEIDRQIAARHDPPDTFTGRPVGSRRRAE